MNTINKIFNFAKSKTVATVIICILILGLLAGVFSLGVAVGVRKANFSYAWGENYEHNFGGPRGGFFGVFTGSREFIDAHGTAGQILEVENSSVVIRGQDNIEKIILISDDTMIRGGTHNVTVSNLMPNEFITAIGEPNDQGQIIAKFIRVMPGPSVTPQVNF